MSVRVDIAGGPPLDLDYLLLDVNGTLSDRGTLLTGVEGRLHQVRKKLDVRLLSADTFGTLSEIAAALEIEATNVADGDAKRRIVRSLGSRRCAAIGNGANDAGMLREATLGIAVLGAEGTASATLAAVDLVCRSITETLDLLLEPRALAASLRG